MTSTVRGYLIAGAATVALFAGLLFIASREKSTTPSGTSGAAYSLAFDENAKVSYFYSDLCHFCQQQKPILDTLAGEGYRVKPMDVRVNPSLFTQYNISGTPTFVAENNDRLVGLQSEANLRIFLDAHGGKLIP
jgi:thiol-disulfide isomerase/thioredoxin